VAQLDRRGPSGIWVVSRWAMIQPFEQVVPPSDEEATALLEAFLQARIDGEGAEDYLGDEVIPLLYASTTGAPYERFEIEPVSDDRDWPLGEMVFRVRLFAQGGETVVEQLLLMNRDETGRLVLHESSGEFDVAPTTENGQAVTAGEVAPTQMEAIRQTVAAANSQHEENLRRLFAEDAEVNPGVWGSISVTTPNSVNAWFFNLDAWGFEGELVECRPVGAGVDCEVRARWHTLSAESVEEWSFVFDGDVIRTLTITRVDPNPSDRVLPLGMSDLDDWENWLESTDPATARRLIPDAATLRLIVPFLRYDATFADEIGESIKKYMVEG